MSCRSRRAASRPATAAALLLLGTLGVARADTVNARCDIHPKGSDTVAKVVAFSANKRKSLSEIDLPPVSDDAKAAQGYVGHDDFAVVEGTLVRRFPVYKDGDSNAAPSGGVRQMQYTLKAGEANWQLKLDRVIEY
jgi:hypothetical protein